MHRLIALFCVVSAATSLVVGCSSDSSSGSPGGGGSGGSGTDTQCVGDYSDLTHGALSSGVTASGMCADAADVSSVCGNDVTSQAETCGLNCLTDQAADMDGCVGDCLATQVKPALSAGCTSCYVTDVGCARDNCKFMCLSPTSTACTTCRQQNGCIDAFYACSGLPLPGATNSGAGGAGDTTAGDTAGAGG